MHTQKERKLLKLALSKKKNPDKIKDEIIEILLNEVKPIDLIIELSERKTEWAKAPLKPEVKPSKFSITEYLNRNENRQNGSEV